MSNIATNELYRNIYSVVNFTIRSNLAQKIIHFKIILIFIFKEGRGHPVIVVHITNEKESVYYIVKLSIGCIVYQIIP